MRAGSAAMRQHLESQLGAAYPQAILRALEPDADPARSAPGRAGRSAARSSCARPRICRFAPSAIWRSTASTPRKPIPSSAILSAVGDLPAGWRAVSQLVLQPAEDDWCREYLRLAVQHPLAPERVPRPAETSAAFVVFMALLLGVGALGLQAYAWYQTQQWGPLALVAAAATAIGVLAPRLQRRLLRRSAL